MAEEGALALEPGRDGVDLALPLAGMKLHHLTSLSLSFIIFLKGQLGEFLNKIMHVNIYI